MKVKFFSRLLVVLILSISFVLFSFITAWAELNCLATGLVVTGSEIAGMKIEGTIEAATTLSTHTAHAEEGASFFGGFSLHNNEGGGLDPLDGAIFAGMGMGKEGNSLELTLTIADVSQFKDAFFSAKYQFLSETASRPALAIGVEAINEIPAQLERSPYIVASKCFTRLQIPVVASLGWGTGRFNNNFFGALALVITKRWTVIAEYDGLGGNVGTSFAFELPKGLPLIVVTIGAQDLFLSPYDTTFTLGAGIRLH